MGHDWRQCCIGRGWIGECNGSIYISVFLAGDASHLASTSDVVCNRGKHGLGSFMSSMRDLKGLIQHVVVWSLLAICIYIFICMYIYYLSNCFQKNSTGLICRGKEGIRRWHVQATDDCCCFSISVLCIECSLCKKWPSGFVAFATALWPKDGGKNSCWSTWHGWTIRLGRVHTGAYYSCSEFATGACPQDFLCWRWYAQSYLQFIRLLRQMCLIVPSDSRNAVETIQSIDELILEKLDSRGLRVRLLLLFETWDLD